VNDQQQRSLSAGCLRDKRPLYVNGMQCFYLVIIMLGFAITRGF